MPADGETFKVIISNANMQTLENGSLYIREVGRGDAGHYMVQAINGVGPGISLVVRLTVNGASIILILVFPHAASCERIHPPFSSLLFFSPLLSSFHVTVSSLRLHRSFTICLFSQTRFS